MIQLTDVRKSFGKGDGRVEALRGVSLTIQENEMVAVMGTSGSGKSTLLNIMGGLMEMSSGEYLYRGQKQDFSRQKNLVSFRRKEVGFVVQYFALLQDMNVYKNVSLPLRYLHTSPREMKKRVHEILRQVGLSEKWKAYPDELSGGQQQRVAIARALVKNPQLILADEPTGALDKQTGREIMELFQKLHREKRTVVIVTHDEEVAGQCQRIIRLEDGKILES